MYSIVRNPLYLGNFLMVLRVVLVLRVWWLSLLYLLVFTIYYERIIFAEEMFLKHACFSPQIERVAAAGPLALVEKSLASRVSWSFRNHHGVFRN